MKLLTNYLSFVLLFFISSLNAQDILQAKKDTIFFKYDSNYIIQSKSNNNVFYITDNNHDASFIFIKKRVLCDLKGKKIISLKKYIRSSKFYKRNNKRKLSQAKLVRFFSENYVVFLVKKGKIFIEVDPGLETL